jgi:hypothetical protein
MLSTSSSASPSALKLSKVIIFWVLWLSNSLFLSTGCPVRRLGDRARLKDMVLVEVKLHVKLGLYSHKTIRMSNERVPISSENHTVDEELERRK